ncbi:MAG: nucleotidyl transferase AbiEii/AbiGii toxin family protein [Candidatus Bipolaricaulaceae bacterium]
MRILRPTSHGLLTPGQTIILEAFAGLPDSKHFFLTGGTALAELYLGHRRSFDLDLFTSEAGLILPFSRIVERELPGAGLQVRIVRRLASFVQFAVKVVDEEVRVQLAYDSPFRFHPPEETQLVKVNDFQDLAVDKFLAFFGRAEPRDAVDLFFLLKEVSLAELIELAPQKDAGFDPYWLARAFQRVQSFPDEPERWPVEMVVPWNPREMKSLFARHAQAVLENLRKGGQGC